MPATPGTIEKVGTQNIVWAPATLGNASNSRDDCKSRDARNSMGTSNIRECQQQQGMLATAGTIVKVGTQEVISTHQGMPAIAYPPAREQNPYEFLRNLRNIHYTCKQKIRLK
jgi:hypothetical protein